MDFFSILTLLTAAGLLVIAFRRARSFEPRAYRKALLLLLAAWILYYPVSELFMVGVYLSFVVRPVGFVLGALSFRLLCLALFDGSTTIQTPPPNQPL